MAVEALTAHTGIRLAEVGFVLLALTGVWLVVAEARAFRRGRARGIVAGVGLAAAGILLIVATHWGHFG